MFAVDNNTYRSPNLEAVSHARWAVGLIRLLGNAVGSVL